MTGFHFSEARNGYVLNDRPAETQSLLLPVEQEHEKPADIFEMVRRRDELLFQCADALDEIFAMGIMTPQERTALNALRRVVSGRRRPEAAALPASIRWRFTMARNAWKQPWGSWVRNTQAPIWKRFIAWNENQNILWNMDANDEVRDHLKAYVEGSYINSDYFEHDRRIFEKSFRCPWMMRDLYQFMVLLHRALRACTPIERFKHFKQELGYLEAEDGQRFDFGFLLPDDLREGEYPIPEDWEDQMARMDEELPEWLLAA